MSASDQQKEAAIPDDYIQGDAFEEKLFEKELQHIRKQYPDVDKEDLFGLAFSGGGIRSSTFALGVAQALARSSVFIICPRSPAAAISVLR